MKDLPSKLAGLFDELSAKIFKRSLDIPSIERLHVVTRKMANHILLAAELKALEACRKLNEATGLGFKNVAEDVAKLETRQEKLEKLLIKIDRDLTGLRNSFAALQTAALQESTKPEEEASSERDE